MKSINKILAVILSLILSISALSISVSAFEFNGEDRTIKDIYADWLKAQKDFLSGNSSLEDLRNANIRFQNDLIAQNLDFNQDMINGVVDGIISGSTCGIVPPLSDEYWAFLETNLGIQNPRDAFLDWYQNKYGKEYGKHDNPFSSNFDTSGMNYYIFSHSTGYEYKTFLSYSGPPLTVYETSNGIQYFMGTELGTITYRSYMRTQYASGEWGDWEGGKLYTGGISAQYLLNNSGGSGTSLSVDSTNLPLNYWGDIIGGDPVIDWEKEFGFEDGDPGMTTDEYSDYLDQLLSDLLNSMPDLGSVEGILRAIYGKCCSIDSKLNKQDKSDIKDLINAAVLSLSKSNDDNANKIISALGQLKNGLDSNPDAIVSKLDEIQKILTAWGIADTITDIIDLDSLSEEDLAKLNAVADIAILLSGVLPIAVVNSEITLIQSMVFNQAPPTDLTFKLYDSDCILLSSNFFSKPNVVHAVSIARTFVSIVLLMMWLLSMRRKLTNIG